jgi:hypothetical protein
VSVSFVVAVSQVAVKLAESRDTLEEGPEKFGREKTIVSPSTSNREYVKESVSAEAAPASGDENTMEVCDIEPTSTASVTSNGTGAPVKVRAPATAIVKFTSCPPGRPPDGSWIPFDSATTTADDTPWSIPIPEIVSVRTPLDHVPENDPPSRTREFTVAPVNPGRSRMI